MAAPFTPCIGGILSADIAVPEHDREVRFYSRVLGTGDPPLWRDDLMNNLGLPVIGLGVRTEEYAHLPLQWMPHIQVADVAASVERAVARGGSVVMQAKADDGTSQWAVLVDADGAAFGIMPVVPADALPPLDRAAGSDGAVGRIVRAELTVRHAESASTFYQDVIGWTVRPAEGADDAAGGDTAYEMVAADGGVAARIREAREAVPAVPAVWLIHLAVGDVDESVRRVEAEGGTILQAARGTEGRHAYAAIKDPVGACVAVVPAQP